MNVYQKLNVCRSVFHKLQLKKSGQNKFAGYFYFELGDFLVPALSIFNEYGLCATIAFGSDEARMEIVNVDKPDEKIVITSPMSTAQLKGCHEVQNLGAVQTYIRRYLWVAALEITEHDAVDSSKSEDGPGRLGEVVKALDAQNGWALLSLAKMDDQGYRFAFGRLNTKQKANARELEQKAAMMRLDYVASLNETAENNDEAYALQLLEELPAEGKRLVWEMVSEEAKTFIRNLKENR